MARSLELDDLFRLQFVSDAQISPDGARVAYVVTQANADADENRSRVYVVEVADAAGREPRALTSGPADSSPRWSPDGRWLAFVAKRAGDDRPQVWLLPTAGGEARRLTSLTGGASSPVWSPDGSRIAFLSAVDLRGEPSNDKEKAALSSAPIVHRRLDYKADGAGLVGGRRQHLFTLTLDGDEEKATQLTDGDFSVGGIAWSPSGDEIAYVSAKHDDRDLNPSSSVYVVALASGQSRQVTPSKGSASAPAWTADGSTIVFVGKADPSPGHARLFSVPSDGGEPSELAPSFDRNVMVGAPGYPGAPPRVLADGTVVFCARDRGCTHVYRLATGAEPEKILGGDDRVASAFTVTRDGSTTAFVSSSPSSTGEVHVADASGGNERPLTAYAAALEGVDLVRPEPRVFLAPDGTEVHGWLLRDRRAASPGPLLLDIHGGPHNAWTPAFDGAHLYHQTLVAEGWSILTLNPRGSDGYGEGFLTALTGAWGRADIDDFLAPIDALVAEGIADPSRLAVTGYSYGGYMTCWLTTQTERFAAAVPGGCLSNLTSFFGTSDVGAGLGAFEIGGNPWNERARFEDLSPITHVENVKTPTLVLHGGSDDRCPVEQGEEWFTALRVLGVESEMVRYPGASHLFIVLGRPSHRIDYCRRVHDWVAAHTT